LESIDESIELAEAGLAQDPLNLGYEILWCRAQLRKLERERTPDAQQKHLAAIESRLAKAIERIPAAREAALKSEKRDERDSKLMQAAQFELDLRTELVDIKLAMLELGGLANAEIPKKQAEVGKLIDELQSYINSPGAIQFLRAKRQYIDLIVANR